VNKFFKGMKFHLREGSPVEKNSACEVLIYGYVTVERRLLIPDHK
jgi:hypothetical protein